MIDRPGHEGGEPWPGRQLLQKIGLGRGHEAQFGPEREIAVGMRAPSLTASFCPSPVAVGLTPEALASCAPIYFPLSSGSFVKSPLVNTTAPRALNTRRPCGVEQATAVTRPSSVINSSARAAVTMVTSALRAARSRWRMKEREFGSTLCMRGFVCGGSGIGP